MEFVRQTFPNATSDVIDYISQVLYPPRFDGSLGYRDQIQRTALSLGELVYSCNTNYLARALNNETYNYLVSIPPALHGWDVPYTFFNGPNPGVVNETVALSLQRYIVNFATSGNPNGEDENDNDGGGGGGDGGDLVPFEKYGESNDVLNFGRREMSRIDDPTANERCRWWQQALYL